MLQRYLHYDDNYARHHDNNYTGNTAPHNNNYTRFADDSDGHPCASDAAASNLHNLRLSSRLRYEAVRCLYSEEMH